MTMKRLIVGALVLLILLLGGGGAAWWFFLRGPAHQSPAAYLPADTLYYFEIPDGTRTYLRYQQSQLKQIADDPQAQGLVGAAFSVLDGALHKLDPQVAAHLRQAAVEGLQAMGGSSFVALTRLDPPAAKDAPPAEIAKGIGLIAGFHASPDKGRHVEAFFSELEAAAGDHLKNHPVQTAAHGDLSYTYREAGNGLRLCRARWKDWDLVSLGEQPLFDFIDHASAAGAGAGGPSLRETPDYQALASQCDPQADTLFYANIGRAFDLERQWFTLFMPAGMGNGSGLDAVFKNLRFMHATAGTMSLGKNGVEEHCVVLAPLAERGEMASQFQPIPLKSARFTSPSTVFYLAQNIDAEATYNQQRETFQAVQAQTAPTQSGAPAAPNPYDTIEGGLKSQGLDLHENFLKAVGPELAWVVDWPEGQKIPDLLLVWALRDPDKFSLLYDKLTKQLTPLLAMAGTSETFTVGSFSALSVAPKQLSSISPTLFKGSDFWGFSLTAAGAKRLLADGNPALSLDTLAGPGKADGAYLLAYAKVGEVLQRGYAAGKPALAKYLAADPARSSWANLSTNLPADLTVAPLLGEFRFRAGSKGDFLISDSASPTGSVVLLAGLAAAVAPPLYAYSQQHPQIAGTASISAQQADAEQLSLALNLYGATHDGQYPATLDLLLQEPEAAEHGIRPSVLTDPAGTPRWIYHAGLTTSATGETVLFESMQILNQGGQPGRIYSRIDKQTLWQPLGAAAPVPVANAPAAPSDTAPASPNP